MKQEICTMDGFLIKIAEIRTALDASLFNCALAVSLTFPDVCGEIEFPQEASAAKRYSISSTGDGSAC